MNQPVNNNKRLPGAFRAGLLIFLFFCLPGFSSAQQKAPVKEWTLLIYINGNSQPLLQKFNEEALNELENQGSGPGINVVVQISRGDDFARARRYYMGPDKKKKLISRLGKTDMGNPATLSDFIRSGMADYPAKRYCIALKGHGAGHLGLMKDLLTGSKIETDSFQKLMEEAAVTAGGKIDLLALDSCHGANGETAYAIRNSVRYLLASQEISFAPNWEYGRILKTLKEAQEKGELSPLKMAEIFADGAGNHWFTTISCIDLEKMDGFAQRLKTFSKALMETFTPDEVISEAFKKSTSFSNKCFWPEKPDEDFIRMTAARDAASLALSVATDSRIFDGRLKKAAADLYGYSRYKTVVFSRHSDAPELQEAFGLSIYAPLGDVPFDGAYYSRVIKLASDTGWDRVVEKFSAGKPR